MKKNTLLSICLLVFAGILFSSCKKDTPAPPPSQAELIKGTWSLVNQKMIVVVNGEEVSSETYIGKPQDFLDFGNTGKVTIHIDGEEDVSSFVVLANSKILIDDEEGTITQLNANTCTITFTFATEDGFEKLIINLKK